MNASLAQARRQQDLAAQAWILTNLGNGHLDQHRFDEAMQCFTETLKLCHQLDDHSGQMWAYIGIGRVHQAGNEHHLAAEHYELAQTTSSQLGGRWPWAIATSYLADAHRALGKYDAALDSLEQTAATLRELGDHQAESCALNKIADVHHDLGDLHNTLAYLEQALAASVSVADLWGQAAFQHKLGDVHHELDEHDEARQAWENAVQLFEALGDARATGIRAQLALLVTETVPAPRQECRT
ncbi:tetratricopeptide repeat protein [Saccharothrix syringae]|uniref:tetratricopeptide repeat protein n=1 Tax=Saccharothrix syringae TaxID=103733 RepID=UPI00052520E3|nr:tetratricopeptide repeat protein [Saccharothrix syringae]